MRVRSLLYRSARIIGDAEAISRGRYARRFARRAAYRSIFRLIGRR